MTLDKYLWLVNKNNLFDKKGLEKFDLLPIRDTDGKTYIESETKKAFDDLRKYMEKTYGVALFLTSAGRSVETQQKVMDDLAKEMDEEELLKTVALPGTTEHHTGLALDVKPEIAHSSIIQRFVNTLPIPERIAYMKQPNKEEKDLMYANLHASLEQFGFILRYTKDKQETTGFKPERWHIRYVGLENAKAMNEKGMCLEEYVEYLQSQSQTELEDSEETAAKAEFDKNVQQVIVVHPVVNKVFEEAKQAKQEEKVQ